MRKLFFNQLLQSHLLPQPVFLMHYTQLIFDGYFPTSNNANRMTGNILEWRHMCVHMCDCAILPVYFRLVSKYSVQNKNTKISPFSQSVSANVRIKFCVYLAKTQLKLLCCPSLSLKGSRNCAPRINLIE